MIFIQELQQIPTQNYLIAPNTIMSPNTNMPPNAPNTKPSVPQPIVANSQLALNKKINLEEQTYDYRKYFFV